MFCKNRAKKADWQEECVAQPAPPPDTGIRFNCQLSIEIIVIVTTGSNRLNYLN